MWRLSFCSWFSWFSGSIFAFWQLHRDIYWITWTDIDLELFSLTTRDVFAPQILQMFSINKYVFLMQWMRAMCSSSTDDGNYKW